MFPIYGRAARRLRTRIISGLQYPPRVGGVLMHLHDESIQRREVLLVAQLRHELDFDLPTVQVAREVEHMRLEQRVRTCNCGAGTQTCNTRQGRTGHSMHHHREYPRNRSTPPLDAQVRGRETQVPAQAVAM